MKTKPHNTSNAFAEANNALRHKKYNQAFELYQIARKENSELHELIDFNLKLIKSRTSQRLSKEGSTSYALVVHAFHLDTLPDLVAYSRNFPEDADQYVTYPDTFNTESTTIIKQSFPRAHLVPVPNVGQDIGALFKLMENWDLSHYEFICKIHTKKGNKMPDEWRHCLLKGVLGSKSQVKNTINLFRSDSSVKLAGAKQLYIYGPSNLWQNSKNIQTIFGDVVGAFDFQNTDWGFFAGTCFWVSTDILVKIHQQMKLIALKPAAYTDDGMPAHAAERMFGLLPAIENSKIILNDVVEIGVHELAHTTFPKDLGKSQISIVNLLTAIDPTTKAVEKTKNTEPSKGSQSKLLLRGSLELVDNRAEIHGWLAAMGDNNPRNAIIRVGSEFASDLDVIVQANTFRSDLKKHNINQGGHAFSVTVPHAFMDDKKHKVFLIDADTNSVVSQKTCQWKQPKRSYLDFAGFLKSSMTQPMISAPFTEEDKRSFAVMENIADRLSRKATEIKDPPLVSIVMPTYNREDILPFAIQSILAQKYEKFELIIVDDCSSDNSIRLIESYSDKRIRLLKQAKNQGHSAARNKGLEAAEGSIITYLDSDNSWDSRYIGAVVGAFMSLPKAQAIYSGQFLYRGYATNPFAIRYGHFNRALLENNSYIDLNAFAHRRGLLSQLIGFDETLKRYVDYDLILRASELGVMYSVPVILSHYFYDKAVNTVTNDSRHVANMDVVRNHMHDRANKAQKDRSQRKLDKHVSVIIPNWESLEDIRECLDSMLALEWSGMLSIIVIDNASSSEVRNYLQSASKNATVTVIQNSKNYGFTYAVNQGIACAAEGSDILLLNNDAIIHGGAIQALQNACYQLHNAGMTVPRQILPKNTKTLRTHVPYADDKNACDVNISAHHQNIADIPLFHDGGALELSYAAFFAVYIRRDVIENIGVLDAEFGRHYRSDRTYCDLMRTATNRKLYYVPEAMVTHKLQKSTDSLRDKDESTNEFDLMFRRNQWDTETATALKFRKAAWDFF